MWYYQNYNELYHHGILGMRWGVRKDDNANGVENKSKRHLLSDKQKKYIKIGAGVTAAILVTYGAYKLSSKKVRIDKAVGEMQANDLINKVSSEKKFKKPQTIIEKINEVHNVNPGGFHNNCAACSATYSLRLRGINVQAKGLESEIVDGHLKSLHSVLPNIFKDVDAQKNCTSFHTYSWDENKDVKSAVANNILRKWPEGAHGAIEAQFKDPTNASKGSAGGHAWNWIIDSGKVLFVDGQNQSEECSRYFHNVLKGKDISVFRLDNLELKDEASIERFIKKK